MTKLSEKTGGGLIYAPPMMQFDGATAYYLKNPVTVSGSDVAMCVRIKRASFTGDAYEVISLIGNTRTRCQFIVISSNHSTLTNRQGRLQVDVQNSAGTGVVKLISKNSVLDGLDHTVFFSYEGSTGNTVFYIDGVDADDTSNPDRVTPVSGTLETGSGFAFSVGASTTNTQHFGGEIGCAGYRDAYLTNWQDFMDSQGNPKALDQFGWTQWGGGTFAPASQDFDGSTGYFTLAAVDPDVTAGFAICGRFRWDGGTITSAGGYNRIIAVCEGTSARIKVQVAIVNDQTGDNTAGRLNIYSVNGSGTAICSIFSNTIVSDGTEYTFFASYNQAAGTAVLVLNGSSDLNTGAVGHTLTTGTPASGSGTNRVGSNVSGSRLFNGLIGFLGLTGTPLTNWSDFMDATGAPQEIDELNWTEWGGQPLFWNKYGSMDDNKGSAGNMTRTGTVTHTPNSQPLFWHPAAKMDENEGEAGAMTENGTILLSDAGSQGLPMIGLSTTADAVAHNLTSTKTAWVDGVELVGTAYTPAMMELDGSSGYYSLGSLTTAGNKITLVGRIKTDGHTGGGSRRIVSMQNNSPLTERLYLILWATDRTPTDEAGTLLLGIKIDGSTFACQVNTSEVVTDGAWHTFFISFDADTGTLIFKIDGVDATINTGATNYVAPTTGTLCSGASSTFYVGTESSIASYLDAEVGFLGYRDAALTNWSDFVQADGTPKALDETTWAEWGSQPMFWNEHGEMTNNLGSAANMTKTGTIVVGKGGNT